MAKNTSLLDSLEKSRSDSQKNHSQDTIIFNSIKIRHYCNVFSDPNPLYVPPSDYGESATDKASYRPDISSARSFAGSIGSGTSSQVGVYDFPDGKDTGRTIQTFLRNRGLDVTEIEAASTWLKDNAQKLVDEDNEKMIAELKDKTDSEIIEYFKNLAESAKDNKDNTENSQNNTQ